MTTTVAAEQYSKPIFSLEFNIFGTGAEIRVNDIPVYNHDAPGQTNSQKTISEHIVNGNNTLSIKSFPIEEDNFTYREAAYIEAIISIRENDAPSSENKPIAQLKLSPTNSEDTLLSGTIKEYGEKYDILQHSDKSTLAMRAVSINSPFPRWKWEDGINIENTPDNYNNLLKIYSEIWHSLNSGNITQLRKFYDPAAQEYALAYHHTDLESGHRLMGTGSLIGNDEWGLGGLEVRLKKRKYYLDIYANGKLARLVDSKGNESLITYLHKKVRMVNFQKFGFYKNKNGEWIMIR